jgi:hypothetical protein
MAELLSATLSTVETNRADWPEILVDCIMQYSFDLQQA